MSGYVSYQKLCYLIVLNKFRTSYCDISQNFKAVDPENRY